MPTPNTQPVFQPRHEPRFYTSPSLAPPSFQPQYMTPQQRAECYLQFHDRSFQHFERIMSLPVAAPRTISLPAYGKYSSQFMDAQAANSTGLDIEGSLKRKSDLSNPQSTESKKPKTLDTKPKDTHPQAGYTDPTVEVQFAPTPAPPSTAMKVTESLGSITTNSKPCEPSALHNHIPCNGAQNTSVRPETHDQGASNVSVTSKSIAVNDAIAQLRPSIDLAIPLPNPHSRIFYRPLPRLERTREFPIKITPKSYLSSSRAEKNMRSVSQTIKKGIKQ